MRQNFGIVLVLGAGILAAQEPPQQAQRGMALFSEKKCVTCHKLGSSGTAIAPDLSTVARISPKAITIMIKSTRTEFVRSVKLKNGDTFPGMEVKGEGGAVRYFDLSKDPPEARNVEKADVAEVRDNEKWKHPPASAGLTDQQLADVIAYIRWVSYKDRKGVDPADVR